MLKTSSKNVVDKDGNMLYEYKLWQGMTNRCDKNFKNYEDVHYSEFFSEFNNFKHWCNRQKGFNVKDDKGRLWCLDKDIVGNGKLYSEDCCVFIPTVLNVVIRNQHIGKYPRGVNMTVDGKFKAKLTKDYKQIEKYGFLDPMEAFDWYIDQRIKYLNELADKYYHVVDERVFPALRDMFLCPKLNNINSVYV